MINKDRGGVQRTIAGPLCFSGRTLHGGGFCRLTLHPASTGGIVFVRRDVPPDRAVIPALWDRRVPSELCTQLRNDAGVSVAMVEHVLAALAGCGIDHARVVLDGDELPALDGSAAPYTEAILEAGTVALSSRRRFIRLSAPVRVEDGDRSIQAVPSEEFSLSCRIDFDYFDPQEYRFRGNFRRDIAPARTFCFAEDIEAMRARGRGLGGSLDNAVVLSRSGVVNPGGLRFADECVRHKILDMIGDLFLAGAPILADIRAERPGHALTHRFLRRLMMDERTWGWGREGSIAERVEEPSFPDEGTTVAA